MEYKISQRGNSGIFIRTSEKGRPAFEGMEIQILDDCGEETTKKSIGAIYAAIVPDRNMSRPAGDWNQVEITCKERQVRRLLGGKVGVCEAKGDIWMNGERIVDVNLDEHPEELKGEKPSTPLKSRLPKGYIGLQNHSSPVSFRNIRIKEL